MYPTLESLAQEAHQKYQADPTRLERALQIAQAGRFNIFEANRDEFDQTVKPSRNLIIVRSSDQKAWYFIRPQDHSCSCKDAELGHLCKHRLAAWMFYELIDRSLSEAQAAARRARIAANLKALGF